MPAAKKKKGDSDGDDEEKGDPMHPLLVALYVMLGSFVVVAIICGGLYYYRSRLPFTILDGSELSALNAMGTSGPRESVDLGTAYDPGYKPFAKIIMDAPDDNPLLLGDEVYDARPLRAAFFNLARRYIHDENDANLYCYGVPPEVRDNCELVQNLVQWDWFNERDQLKKITNRFFNSRPTRTSELLYLDDNE